MLLWLIKEGAWFSEIISFTWSRGGIRISFKHVTIGVGVYAKRSIKTSRIELQDMLFRGNREIKNDARFISAVKRKLSIKFSRLVPCDVVYMGVISVDSSLRKKRLLLPSVKSEVCYFPKRSLAPWSIGVPFCRLDFLYALSIYRVCILKFDR